MAECELCSQKGEIPVQYFEWFEENKVNFLNEWLSEQIKTSYNVRGESNKKLIILEFIQNWQ